MMNEEQRKYFDEVSKQALHAQIVRYSMTPDASELKVMGERAVEVAKHMLKLRDQFFNNEN